MPSIKKPCWIRYRWGNKSLPHLLSLMKCFKMFIYLANSDIISQREIVIYGGTNNENKCI